MAWIPRSSGDGAAKAVASTIGGRLRIGSYSSRVSAQLGAREMPIGEIKIKPLMIGLDYRMPRGKWHWAAGMAVGWAMNSFDLPWEDRASATD